MRALKSLMARTDEHRKQRAAYVKIIKTKIGHNKLGQGYIAAQTYSTHKVGADGRMVRNTNKHRYLTMLTFVDKKLHVVASCSCGDQTFRWEWANTQKGAAEIEYSNGEPPTTTNPTFKIGLCKHQVALVNLIKPKLPQGYL
jgi:hypothetical protein